MPRVEANVRKAVFRDGDVISGGLLAALGLYIVLEARTWPYSGPAGPGPGFFPLWYGVLMVALSLVLVGGRIAKARVEDDRRADWGGIGRALGTWLAFVTAVALLKPLGFVLSLALLTFFIVAVIFRRSVMAAGLTAGAVALGFHLTFPVALGVQLPVGLLGI
jgi:putative tricarboxylic transport membrane protein